MIIVKRGYTLTEHEPTTYNYRYQSVPSPISRTNIYPLDEYDPPDVLPKATTDTGSPVYLASQLTAGAFEGRTEIDCYFSWRSTRGRGKHDQLRSVEISPGKYDLREIYDDNLWGDLTLNSETPILIAFICEQITMSLTNAHQYNYVAESVRYVYQYTSNGGTHIGRRYLHFNYDSDYNSILLAQTGRHTQQDYLYTVTGGIVGG